MPARTVVFLLAFTLLITPALRGADEFQVYPQPQQMELTGGMLDLAGAEIVWFNGPREELSGLAAQLSSELADRYLLPLPCGTPAGGNGARISIGFLSDPEIRNLLGRTDVMNTPEWDRPEGYRVVVNSDGAVIAGHNLRGLFYGIQSFIQLTSSDSPGSAYARGADIRDWPFKPIRGVHVYLPAREDLPFFRNYIRTMAHYKINTLIIEVGGGMRLDSHPEVNTAWERFCRDFHDIGDPFLQYGEQVPLGPNNRFQASVHTELGGGSWLTKEEVRELADFARAHQMDVVPEIQSLSHAYYLMLAHRGIAEIPEADYPDSYDPANPESYDLLFDVIDEYLEVIEPEWVHIGHDEWRAGLMPDPGKAFAEDVLKIHGYLRSRGIRTMMWADHLVSGHNMEGRQPEVREEGVWYAYPSTVNAREPLSREAGDILMLNWSWGVDPTSDSQLREHGWKQIFGNFTGSRNYGTWHDRLAAEGVLGAEMSTWCLANELSYGQNGSLQNMLFSQNLLWSSHVPPAEKIFEHIAAKTPLIRETLSGSRLPSREVLMGREGYGFLPLDISAAANSAGPAAGETDLGEIAPGEITRRGIPFLIGRGDRRFAVADAAGSEVRGIPVGTNPASLLFLHASTAEAPKRSTYFSNYPEDTALLLGYYRIRYSDGFVMTVPIRYGRNISHPAGSFENQVYFTHTVDLREGGPGGPLVVYAWEWVNPRPNRAIEAVDLVGVGNEAGSYPALLALTAVTQPFEK